MSFPIGGYIGIVAIGLVVVLLLVGARGRGKLIECPECGERFKRPAFAEKNSGMGLSLPGVGSFACPKCNFRGSTSSFKYVDDNLTSGTTSYDGEDKDNRKIK